MNPNPLLEIIPPELPQTEQPSLLSQDFDDLPEVLKPFDPNRVSQVVVKQNRDLISTKIIGVISRSYDFIDQENIRRSFNVSYFSREYNPLLTFINADSVVSYQPSLYPASVVSKLGYQPLPDNFNKIYKIENPDGFTYELESEESDQAIINKCKDGQLISIITLSKGKIIAESKF
jgi:hypothetical protein